MAEKPPLSEFHVDGSDDNRRPLSSFHVPQENQELSLLDVPGQVLQNLGPSAKRFGESLIQPVIHPIETAENIGRLGLGVGEKLGISPTQGHEQYADAAWNYMVDRYGGYENLKKTAATDPVGFVADVAMLATGGEALPGKIGAISEAVNPLRVAGKVASKTGDVGGAVVGRLTGQAPGFAAQATKAGFEGSPDFMEHMRAPDVNAPELLPKARKALSEIRHERSIAYQNGMLGVKADHTPLDFTEINQAVDKARRIKQFEGHDISQLAGANERLPAEKVRDKIESAVGQWEVLPDKFRTAAGMDALKQYIGDIKDGLQFGSPERKVAEEIYGSVRKTIIDQRPEYAKVMKDYEQASTMLNELEKTLSLGKKGTADTALRKLLSSTRHNVNTNFGRRSELVEELNKRDPSIVPSLYGQAAAPMTAGGLMGPLSGALGLGGAFLHPHAVPLLAATSPRLWGELLYKLGQGGKKVSDFTPQQLIDLARRVNPDVLAQLGLTARSSEVSNAPQ